MERKNMIWMLNVLDKYFNDSFIGRKNRSLSIWNTHILQKSNLEQELIVISYKQHWATKKMAAPTS